jgi:hypothetical protein
MIGKDALIKAIRIASGGGGTTPDPADLRLHWDIDDSDLTIGTIEFEDGITNVMEMTVPQFESTGATQVMEMTVPQFESTGVTQVMEFIDGVKNP